MADLYRTEDLKTAIDERRVLLVIQIDHDFERGCSWASRPMCR